MQLLTNAYYFHVNTQQSITGCRAVSVGELPALSVFFFNVLKCVNVFSSGGHVQAQTLMEQTPAGTTPSPHHRL